MTEFLNRHQARFFAAAWLSLLALGACSLPGRLAANSTPEIQPVTQEVIPSPIVQTSTLDVVPSPIVQTASVEVIPSPSGSYQSLAWLGEWIVVDYAEEIVDAYSARIWRLRPDGSEFEMLDLPSHPSCPSNSIIAVLAPSGLPDGRLGYISRCRPPDDNLPTLQFVMAYDMESEEVEPLLDYSVADSGLGTGGMAWNPEMTLGLMADGFAYIAEQLQQFTSEGGEPLDVGLAQAYGPAWSPDGEAIAFIGSEERGLPLRWGDFQLYLMNKEGQQIRPIIEGFKASGGVSWSPDGRWLALPAFFGEVAGEDQGLWLINPESGELRMIAEGGFGKPAWSPDGQRIAVVRFLGPDSVRELRLVIVEFGSILAE